MVLKIKEHFLQSNVQKISLLLAKIYNIFKKSFSCFSAQIFFNKSTVFQVPIILHFFSYAPHPYIEGGEHTPSFGCAMQCSPSKYWFSRWPGPSPPSCWSSSPILFTYEYIYTGKMKNMTYTTNSKVQYIDGIWVCAMQCSPSKYWFPSWPTTTVGPVQGRVRHTNGWKIQDVTQRWGESC